MYKVPYCTSFLVRRECRIRQFYMRLHIIMYVRTHTSKMLRSFGGNKTLNRFRTTPSVDPVKYIPQIYSGNLTMNCYVRYLYMILLNHRLIFSICKKTIMVNLSYCNTGMVILTKRTLDKHNVGGTQFYIKTIFHKLHQCGETAAPGFFCHCVQPNEFNIIPKHNMLNANILNIPYEQMMILN